MRKIIYSLFLIVLLLIVSTLNVFAIAPYISDSHLIRYWAGDNNTDAIAGDVSTITDNTLHIEPPL